MRWIPFYILCCSALLFEPFRSNFEFANQTCKFDLERHQIWSSIANLRHIVGYGVITLVGLYIARTEGTWKIVFFVLMFSAFIELQQSFLTTGHCRLRDMLPNIVGVLLAYIVFRLLNYRFTKKEI